MPLTFDVTQVADHENVTTIYRDEQGNQYEDAERVGEDEFVVERDGEKVPVRRLWHYVTEAIVWRSMNVGIGKLTRDNVAEFYARSRFIDMLNENKPLYIKGEPTSLSMEMLVAHIGLTTNVATEGASWWTRVTKNEREHLTRDAKVLAEKHLSE